MKFTFSESWSPTKVQCLRRKLHQHNKYDYDGLSNLHGEWKNVGKKRLLADNPSPSTRIKANRIQLHWRHSDFITSGGLLMLISFTSFLWNGRAFFVRFFFSLTWHKWSFEIINCSRIVESLMGTNTGKHFCCSDVW